MTGSINSVKIMALGTEIENQWYPTPEWLRVFVGLDIIGLTYMDDISDIEFHITHEGLIINVTNLDGETVATSSETFHEIVERLTDL